MMFGLLTALAISSLSMAGKPADRVIVRLVGQRTAITINSGASGPIYSAADAEGKILVQNASLAELKRTRPKLYQQLSPAICVQNDARDAFPQAIADSN
jgi:hypothetical protein